MLKNFLSLRNVGILWRQIQTTSMKSNSIKSSTFATKTTSDVQTTTQKLKNNDEPEKLAKDYTNPFSNESTTIMDDSSATPELSEAEREKRLKVLQLEVELAFQEGRRVPQLDFFTSDKWEQVLKMPSKSARFKYYSYLWQVEKKKESAQIKKLERAEAVLVRKEVLRQQREENTHIIYGLGHTSLFLRVYDSTINHWQNNRLTRAMQFSPKIVLDCSYDDYMTRREAINAAKQLMLCFAENRAHDDPFDLHYCNVNMKTDCMQSLQRYIPTMLNPEFPMNVHEQCFTSLFPKKNLVYLTPHCRNDLETYNPDDVYIVGAMVDTVNNEPLSLAKAKKLGLRMARLPLDRYLQWGSGSGKSLTLNQMIHIMLDLKTTGDWVKSLAHVPRRKVLDMNYEEVRHKNSLTKRANKLNVRHDQILDFSQQQNHRQQYTEKNVRSRKENMQFDLATWGSKRKNRTSS